MGEGPAEGPRGPRGHAGYSNDGRLAARVRRVDVSAHHAGDILRRWDAAERLSSRVRLMLATLLHPPGRPKRGPARGGCGIAGGRCLVYQRRLTPRSGAANAEIHRLGALRRALFPVARMPNFHEFSLSFIVVTPARGQKDAACRERPNGVHAAADERVVRASAVMQRSEGCVVTVAYSDVTVSTGAFCPDIRARSVVP